MDIDIQRLVLWFKSKWVSTSL